ncbi:MAG: ABC transporter ATP-binding protein [Myxococcota bacterium]
MTELVIDDVWVERRQRSILQGISFRARPGVAVAIMGPNGAGKSTALLTALGLTAAQKGRVRLDGQDIAGYSHRARAARLAWLPQDTQPIEPLPAWEWIAAARFRFRETSAEARHHAVRALKDAGADGFADRAVTTLSGGERQRVALAALFAQDAGLLLADEPASHLDPRLQRETYQRLGARVREGAGLVVITHDVNLLGELRCPVKVLGIRAGASAFLADYPSPSLVDKLSDLFNVRFCEVNVEDQALYVVAPNRESTQS